MASLGKLWFELGLKDRTDKDIEEIRKGVEKRLKSLNVDIGLNSTALRNSIENALRGQQFKIDVVVDKANTTKLIQDAIAKAGINTNVTASDVRAKRIEEINNRINSSNEKQRLQIQKLQEQLRKLRGEYTSTSSAGKRYGDSLGGITKNMRTQFNLAVQLRNQLANIYSVYAAERFLTSIIEIGGQFQQQRVALQTMFQDAQKADILFGQIKELAVESPFEFKELAGYTKQLAAFNIPYEEMYDTTKRLADISAGVGVDMGRIILAYGQVRSAEFLKGTELRQFTEAGIPLLQQLADKFTELEGRVVSVGEVFDRISKREVSFQMVKDVLWDLTNEGGQFYNMQGALADTLAGKLSNLRDAYDVMLSDIAQSNNSTLSAGLDLLTDTMKNWESLSDIILTTVAAYGAYRVAIIALTAAEDAYRNVQISSALLSRTQAMVNAIRTTQGLTAATKAQIIVQRALNAVMKANPIILVASALAALAGSYVLFYDRAKSTDEIITGLNESLGNLQKTFEDLSNTDKMIDEYEELSNKQSKTTEESTKLDRITNTLYERFGGAAEIVDEYGKAIGLSAEKMRELNKQQRENIIAGVNVELKEAEDRADKVRANIDKLTAQIQSGSGRVYVGAGLEGGIDYGFITNKDIDNFKKQRKDYQNELNQLEDSAKKTRDFLKNLGNVDENMNLENALSGWRKAVSDFILGNNELKDLTPKDTEEYVDWYKRLKDALSEAKSDLDKMKGTVGLFDDDTIKKQQGYVNALEGIVKKFNINISDDEKEKGKDPIAERFQRQLDLMKSAMDSYNKYVALIGKEGAVRKVNEDARFAGMDFNPDTYVADLNKLLDNASQEITRSSSLQKFGDSVKKEIADASGKGFEELVKSNLEIARRTIEENTAKWNLYKDLFDITGNRELSMRFAFNVDASAMEGIYTQVDYLKSELERITGHTFDELNSLTDQELTNLLGGMDDSARSLLEQIRNTTRQESDAIIKDVLTLVQKYASADEKIKALKTQRETKLKELRSSDFYANMTPEQQQTAEDSILKEYAFQINEIREETIKLAPIWQKLFGDTANMGYQSMKRLAEEARKMVDSAKEVKDPSTGETRYELSFTDKDGSIKKTTVSLEEYMRIVKQTVGIENDLAESNPFEGLSKGIEDYKKAAEEGDTEAMADALAFTGRMANECADMIGGVTEAWANMFDSLGNEGAADALSFAGDMLGEIGNLAEGLTSGNPIEMATSALTFIPNIISKIANFHDKKLDRAIQKSALEVQKLQNAYTNLQTVIERQLGNITEMQTDALIQNLEKQRSEIEKQMQAEDDKKKTDASKIEDYKQQIVELDDQIKYFYEDLANELYSINFQDWASQLSDSIVNAWRNGEDAAEAFKQTASDILADVVSEMLKMAILEPMFEQLRNQLPQMMEDGSLDSSELGMIAEQLLNIQGGYEQALAYLDQIDKELYDRTNGELSLKSPSSTSSTTTGNSGIQASEETMQLTNSYLNAIRQDVSVIRNIIESTGTSHLPTISITAQAQLQQLNMIAENTRRNADAAAAIQSFLQNDLSGVITTTSGGKALRVK